MSYKVLLKRFNGWRAEGRTLVLGTVVGTAGSTYTKAGHRVLLTADGDCEGLVSGGCLENDLAEHARQVAASGQARVITYDLRADGEELFGLAIGCDGLLRILLQRLTPAEGYEPLTSIAAVLLGETPVHCAILLANHGSLALGTTLIGVDRQNDQPEWAGAEILRTTIAPLPRLLVLGAGQDAVPVVALADTLGWRVTLVDHRPAYLARPGFDVADVRLCAPAAELAERVVLRSFAAALVMSHHLPADRSYLAALADSPLPYIGLLGPPGRRDRLLRELGAAATGLGDRLHGPAGLDIGADSPEAIALSILAEVYRHARGRQGAH